MTWEFITRIFVAALLGGAIGLEREYRSKEAGFRTHFLVALGSTLFMIISQYGFGEVLDNDHVSLDPSRIASQVVTGIGFIGAGTIIFQKHVVRGLTTAAGLWVTSAIGLTCGAGMYMLSIASTTLVLLCLEALNFIINRMGTRVILVTFVSPSREALNHVLEMMKENEVHIDSCKLRERVSSKGMEYVVTMDVKVKRSRYLSNIFEFMDIFENVRVESIE